LLSESFPQSEVLALSETRIGWHLAIEKW